jgi:hypothetical protein
MGRGKKICQIFAPYEDDPEEANPEAPLRQSW